MVEGAVEKLAELMVAKLDKNLVANSAGMMVGWWALSSVVLKAPELVEQMAEWTELCSVAK